MFGFFFAFQRLRDSDVLLIVFGVTGFYFAASLVRLTLILAPAVATLAAITVVELGKPAMDIIQQAVIFPRRKLRFTSRVSREFSLGILLIILILVVPTFINAVQSAYTPTTIASASLPVRGNFPDWLQALTWMNNNLPSTSVVFAWWDYGYWIAVNTGLHTLADNGTGNSTQIQIIATGLMLNESMAVDLLHQYGVTHVAIFISYNSQSGGSPLCPSTNTSPAGSPPVCGYGDDSKWYWMVRIGNGTKINTPLGIATVTYQQINTSTSSGQTQTQYIRYITMNSHTDNGTRITSNYQGATIPTSNTMLGLLMRDGYPTGIGNQLTSDPTNLGYTRPYLFTRVFQSSNDYVLIYKVNYPQTPNLQAILSNPYVQKGGTSKNNITGTLTYPTGLPVSSKTQVILQYAIPGGSWTFIANRTLTTSGTFEVLNYAAFPKASPIYVRAWWNGDPSLGLNMALSANQTLIQL